MYMYIYIYITITIQNAGVSHGQELARQAQQDTLCSSNKLPVFCWRSPSRSLFRVSFLRDDRGILMRLDYGNVPVCMCFALHALLCVDHCDHHAVVPIRSILDRVSSVGSVGSLTSHPVSMRSRNSTMPSIFSKEDGVRAFF